MELTSTKPHHGAPRYNYSDTSNSSHSTDSNDTSNIVRRVARSKAISERKTQQSPSTSSNTKDSQTRTSSKMSTATFSASSASSNSTPIPLARSYRRNPAQTGTAAQVTNQAEIRAHRRPEPRYEPDELFEVGPGRPVGWARVKNDPDPRRHGYAWVGGRPTDWDGERRYRLPEGSDGRDPDGLAACGCVIL